MNKYCRLYVTRPETHLIVFKINKLLNNTKPVSRKVHPFYSPSIKRMVVSRV